MATPHSVPPPITITSGLEITRRDDPHKHRRRFIGPMPQRVVSQLEEQSAEQPKSWFRALKRADTKNDEDAGVRDAIREYALQFFLGHGGQAAEWGEEQERSVREEMYERWKKSEWAQARARRREAKSNKSNKTWIGSSFDVGVFLGVDMLDNTLSVYTPTDAGMNSAIGSASRIRTLPSMSAGADTFVTAPLIRDATSSDYRVSQRTNIPRRFPRVPSSNLEIPDSAHSGTPLLQVPDPLASGPPAQSGAVRRPAGPSPFQPATTGRGAPSSCLLEVPHQNKGKGKAVHYTDYPPPEEHPAPPGEVLARRGTDVEGSSAGAAEHATADRTTQTNKDDIVMRDRMLVQISYSDTDTLGTNFDELKGRATPHIQYYDWSEYVVVWRKDRFELYQNYSNPLTEWVVGHKQLAFVVPLCSTTRLSLYSFTDFTFCVTCPYKPLRKRSRLKGHWLLYGGRKGTNVFIFNLKSRSRAVDWYWKIWRHLGGVLPPFIELRCPTLDAKLKVDIPAAEFSNIDSAYKVFTPTNTVNLCKRVLRGIDDYDEAIGRALEDGATLQLAWRVDARLDWVWHSDDVVGGRRDWMVLYGVAFRQPAHLELRLQDHRMTRIRLKDGTRLDEPPGVEGYADRIKPNSQLKQATYLATHDGYLFFIGANFANPPAPPGPPTDVDPDTLRQAESIRGAKQILSATGMTDLRRVVAVRRAFQIIPRQMEQVSVQDVPQWEEAEGFWDNVEHFDEDHRDVGGSEGLAKAADSGQMRVRRSFELLMESGRVMRFETYSCQVALEWISRLRQLVSYWKKRHQVDARSEMDVVHTATGRPRITPHKHVHADEEMPPEAPPDPDASSPDLSLFYHWCVLEGCRPISKSGRLFGRQGLKGQYRHTQLVLVAGHLVEFSIKEGPAMYHRRRGMIHLLDAYVFSGYLAAQYLPQGQYHPDDPALPRRYQDGLESDDLDEDTLFMVWWYKVGGPQVPENTIPPLAAKRKVSVYRTRSKLERDAWVWAIKAEIEKAVRGAQDRESKVREVGGLLKGKKRDRTSPGDRAVAT